ncbi:MAG: 3-phosphoshikimate 1-carboxyvinyltransferase [Thermotogae bacterium]|nr:3-phosphoshikimate 1-carboxyvinyltransferase [Thermotogota bacterium]
MNISPAKRVRGTLHVPPDKSITHRALILSSFATGKTTLYNLLECNDTLRTFEILKRLSVRFKGDFERLEVIPPEEFSTPVNPLFCGNSGTTARIVMGLLSSIRGFYILYGDESLSRRPMRRVVKPLKRMGGIIMGRNSDENLPIAIRGTKLKGTYHKLEVASAQVKSALILAGIRAHGKTTVEEPSKSRDHTERMLSYMGANLKVKGNMIEVMPSEVNGIEFEVPGDFSSASYFITLAVAHPNAEIRLEDVGLNETRIGLLEILKDMNAKVEWQVTKSSPEPTGWITARTSRLSGVEAKGEIIPKMIDELPLLVLLGAVAHGTTEICDAGELRKKESNRISTLVGNMKRLGVEIEEKVDGFVINGPQRIRGGRISSMGDHRIAMTFSIAGAISEEGVEITDPECVQISFPNFFDKLKEVTE